METSSAVNTIDGKYKVESVLGGGSFSEVYVVTDPNRGLERSALKLLRKVFGRDAPAEVVQDFKHEFAILKDLSHPHIARILDFGYDPQLRQYYYTSELVNGRGLFEATEGKSCDDILEWFVQTLRAFNYLHSYRVHHFDVKSANILLNQDGLVKVIDFGLASIDPGGKMIGTPSYMAPEIIAKEKPDGRADLYSLGVLFYSCFTRTNPFRGKGVSDTLKNQQTLIAPPASSLREDLPSFLDSIFQKLLEKNPANRYQKADEVLREINLNSPKKFALETRETLLSYLPEEGRLIGRRRETEAFKRLSETLFSPSSPETLSFLFVAGDRGSGKTRLLKEFKYEAQLRGLNVVSATARSPEERGAWLEAFRKHATEGRPTVFFLDDLEAWPQTEEGFLQFQASMAKLLFQEPRDRLPMLWVGSVLNADSVPPSLSELLSEQKVETLYLGPFLGEELREYVISLTGLEDPPPDLLEGLEARTDGNPLLVTELLRSLIEEGALFDQGGRWKKTTFEDVGVDFSKVRFSGVLEEILYGRFEKLSDGLREILEALAVGRALRASELSRLCEGADLTRGIEDLAARDLILKDADGRYGVKNVTLAELITHRLSVKRRHQLHDRAAALYEEGDQKIFHQMRGSDVQKAFELCRQTADRHLQGGEGRESAAILDFARNLPIRRTFEQEIELLLKLGESCLISLDYPRALQALGQAESLLSGQKIGAKNVHFQVDALFGIAGVYYKMHEIEKSRTSLAAAAALLHYLKGDSVRELAVENLRGSILMREGKIEEARQLFEETQKRWAGLSEEDRLKVTNNDLGHAYHLERKYPEALTQLCADMEFLQKVGDRFLLARTHYNLGLTYKETGGYLAAVDHFQRAASLAQSLKHTELLLRIYNGLGNVHDLMGQPDDAVRYYERGLDLCERVGDLRSHAAILLNIGIIQNSQSRYDQALRALRPTVAFLKSLKNRTAFDRQVLIQAIQEIGDSALKQKQWADSENCLNEALALAEESETPAALKFWILYTMGELFLAKDEPDRLKKILPEIKKLAPGPSEKEKAEELSAKIAKTAPIPTQPPAPPPSTAPLPEESSPAAMPGTDPLSEISRKVARLLADQEASRRSLEVKVAEIETKLEHYHSIASLNDRSLETKYDYKNIVARSKPMVEIFRLLDKITDTDLSVFIHGESGTGKELIARALHVNGPNSRNTKARFVAVNCGAIPANLMESELFGYKAGAFTGATRDKKGLFEEADGGTIFLDEVAELEVGLQAKLLRVVQEGEFYRVGDSQPIHCEVRVVSASNKDIQRLAKEGKFREDLYYRLCQIRIDLPALRDRREDIPLLVDHFIREESGQSMKVSGRLLKAFLEYDWPGNIRELENLVKVAVALSEGGVIDANAIPSNYGISKYLSAAPHPKPAPEMPRPSSELPKIDGNNSFDPSKSWYDYEKVIIAKAYQANAFNAKETARALGIAPATLYKKIRENGLTERDHILFSDPFRYQPGRSLKDYLKPVFEAALAYCGKKPYTAIAQLKVSQGYFYNVIKGK